LDGNGAINEDELINAMETLEMNMTRQQVKNMIQSVDVNGDGDVSLEEFIKLMVSIRRKNKFLSNDAQIRKAFLMVDEDKDGSIGAEDLMALFKEVGDEISYEVAVEMLMAASSLQEAHVEMKDFIQLMKQEM
jgi:Ca2+-binding EF-hand superfamily protein